MPYTEQLADRLSEQRRKLAGFLADRVKSATREITSGAAPAGSADVKLFHKTKLGTIYLGDLLSLLSTHVKPQSVDLIMTSPPFGLVRKKDYGNVDSHEYLEWFRPFGEASKRVLRDLGS